ncbi:predicted protein [Nematostella vectensis]|uniref:Asteroid domain-containing protein n=1 Tax=Nematostella vectensis TaxID=45351 RepID=A7S0X2_NEMVE|nr:predicted protein [Nematostella vectensis]|eukprot:XP_001634720.1 predicted protein [Nematostella vectensis]
MGIRGLNSYIETLDVWEKIELKDTKVVIDGSCLMFNLYYNSGLDFRNGGEYYEFAQVVTSFFQALSSNNVEAYVVLDGAIDPSGRKVDTIESRMQDTIDNAGNPYGRVRPKLSALVLCQAMRDIGVKFVRIDCEADQEIASLAKKFQCPVLSDDSDFFIFDLPGGFIPLTSLHWHSFPLSTKLYSRQKMADYLQLRPDLMPLFASVLGNDFVSSSAVEPFYNVISGNHTGKAARFRNVADFLRGLECIEEGVDSVLSVINQECQNHLRDALHTSLNSYISVGKSTASYFFISDGGANDGWSEIGGTEFPSWVVNGFRKCAYPSDYISAAISGIRFLACQVENLAKRSSCSCTLDLRRALYAMTQPGKPNGEKHDKVTRIKEWDRRGKILTNYFIDPKYVLEGYGKLPTLIQIKELPLEEREMLFFLLLESNTSTIKLLPKDEWLFVAATRYWIKHANPQVSSISHIEAVILNHLVLPKSRKKKISCVDSLHSFAQWQNVMLETIYTNQVLNFPLAEPAVSGLYGSGVAALGITEQLQKGQEASSIVHPSDHDLYQRLMDAVMEGIHKVESLSSASKKESSKEKPKNKKPPTCLAGNKFALLFNETGSDDDDVE